MQQSNKISDLFNVFLKLDFRDKENSGKKKIIGIVISYLVSNIFLSLNNFHTFDKFSFAIISFSTGVFLLVFIVLNDYSNLFFSKTHTEILGSLPLSEKDIALSKYISAYFYLSFFVVVIVLPQTVFFYFYNTGIIETLQFTILNIIFVFLLSGIIIVIYTFAVYLFDKKASFFIYIIQIIFFAVIMYSTNMTSRASVTGKYNLAEIRYINYLPQYYFAKYLPDFIFLISVFLIMFLIYFLLYLFISKKYISLSEKIFRLSGSVIPKSTLGIRNDLVLKRTLGIRIIGLFIKDKNELASYMLIKNLMSNSRPLKAKFFPLIFLPVIIALIALFSGVPGLLVFESSNLLGIPGIKILSPSITLILIMCFRLLISNTKINEENTDDINWLYESIPIENKKSVIKGINIYIYVYFIFPVLISLFVILSFKIPLLSLLLNLLYIFSISVLINYIYLIFDNTLPFTMNSSKHNSASKLGEIFLIILFGIFIFALQIFVFENIIFILISLFLTSCVSLIINKRLTPKIKLN